MVILRYIDSKPAMFSIRLEETHCIQLEHMPCTYDVMHRLIRAGSTYFYWSYNGNLKGVTDGQDTWNYMYDFENRITSVKKNGAVVNRFWYDAQGRRVRLWDSQIGYLTQVYSGLDIIFENSSSGYTKHFYANGLHIAENRSGTIEYYHQDHLGSTRLKTNSAGQMVFSTNYEPFGPSYAETGTEEFKYTGKYEDTSGLYYFGARYYDPALGRFTTEDPVRGSLTDPQTLNMYVYCRNNPLKYTDPDGKIFWGIIIGAVVGAIIGGASHYIATGDVRGALVSAGIGAIAGAIAGATFGTAALALTSETTMTQATVAIGASAMKTVTAGTVSSVAGGITTRSLEAINRVQAGESLHEDPVFKSENLVADVVGGAVGAGTGYTFGELAGRFSGQIREAIKQAREKGTITRTYAAYEIMKTTTTKFISKAVSDLTRRTLSTMYGFAYGYEYEYEYYCDYYYERD